MISVLFAFLNINEAQFYRMIHIAEGLRPFMINGRVYLEDRRYEPIRGFILRRERDLCQLSLEEMWDKHISQQVPQAVIDHAHTIIMHERHLPDFHGTGHVVKTRIREPITIGHTFDEIFAQLPPYFTGRLI